MRYPFKYPPGHFYSPLPNLNTIRRRESLIFETLDAPLGVDLRESEQIELLEKLATYYPDMPFKREPQEGIRYGFANKFYGQGDAILLYSMLRCFSPRRIVEVGSGHSTCATLDTIDLFLSGKCNVRSIEPWPKRLRSLLGDTIPSNLELVDRPLQDVESSFFDELEENDILFVDSTHVSKIDSDVNHLFFRIFPRLRAGVLIHMHDVYYPFQYPPQWIYEGRMWNETYLLRAFLLYNFKFQVLLWADFLAKCHAGWLQENMPMVLEDPGGSFWMRKL